jgi:hypothetical protein
MALPDEFLPVAISTCGRAPPVVAPRGGGVGAACVRRGGLGRGVLGEGGAARAPGAVGVAVGGRRDGTGGDELQRLDGGAEAAPELGVVFSDVP